LGTLFISQSFLIAAREGEPFAIIKGSNSGKLSVPFAGPDPLEEVKYLSAGCGWIVYDLILQQKVFKDSKTFGSLTHHVPDTGAVGFVEALQRYFRAFTNS
jgi:hypothetical protein